MNGLLSDAVHVVLAWRPPYGQMPLVMQRAVRQLGGASSTWSRKRRTAAQSCASGSGNDAHTRTV